MISSETNTSYNDICVTNVSVDVNGKKDYIGFSIYKSASQFIVTQFLQRTTEIWGGSKILLQNITVQLVPDGCWGSQCCLIHDNLTERYSLLCRKQAEHTDIKQNTCGFACFSPLAPNQVDHDISFNIDLLLSRQLLSAAHFSTVLKSMYKDFKLACDRINTESALFCLTTYIIVTQSRSVAVSSDWKTLIKTIQNPMSFAEHSSLLIICFSGDQCNFFFFFHSNLNYLF